MNRQKVVPAVAGGAILLGMIAWTFRGQLLTGSHHAAVTTQSQAAILAKHSPMNLAAPAMKLPAPQKEPRLSLTPKTVLNFGHMALGRGAAGTLTLSNPSDRTARISSSTIVGDVALLRQGTTCDPKSIPARSSCTISVRAVASQPGPITGQFTVTSEGDAVSVRFAGTVDAPPPPQNTDAELAERANLLAERQQSRPVIMSADYAAARDAGSAGTVTSGAIDASAHVTMNRPFNRCDVLGQDLYISATLETPIIDEESGEVRAQQDRPVYGPGCRHALLPTGTEWIGFNGRGSSQGISRLNITWERLLLPDGSSATFRWHTADMMGRSGVPGHRNLQLPARIGALLLETAFNIGSAATLGNQTAGTTMSGLGGLPITTSNNQALVQALAQSESNVHDFAKSLLSDLLPKRPAITVPKGTEIIIYPGTDLVLRPGEAGEEIVPANPSEARYVAESRAAALRSPTVVAAENKSPIASGDYTGPPPPVVAKDISPGGRSVQ